MEYCNIFIAEYQYNQYNNNIIVPSAGEYPGQPGSDEKIFSSATISHYCQFQLGGHVSTIPEGKLASHSSASHSLRFN